MVDESGLNQIAVARTVQGVLIGVGRVVSYCDTPTITIETPDGGQIHWRADLAQILPLTQDLIEVFFPRVPQGNGTGTE